MAKEKGKSYRLRLNPDREERINRLKKQFGITITSGLFDFLLEAAERDPQLFNELNSFSNNGEDWRIKLKEERVGIRENENYVMDELQALREDMNEIKALLKSALHSKDELTEVITFDKDEM
ncbi:MAG: hypothetical protein HeimC3_35940 [Candidatus Heimdallarchaeota archaeon LC_3]|nr:MAG: hypothetical protein HeimC3_35940 [Candidatus Heimdallarchaeota archaeon LC_3]